MTDSLVGCIKIAEEFERKTLERHPECMEQADWLVMRADYIDTLQAYKKIARLVISEVSNGR